MSDVTGNLGSESIRLRGMALEETQYQILKTLQSMAGGGTGGGKGATLLEQQLDATSTALKNTKNGPLKKMGEAFSSVASAFSKGGGIVSEVFDTMGRTIRGFDSNIRDSSFAMRQMAMSTGKAGAVFKFAAESISQLEEQFDVYKRLANVGGSVASDFDNLRINASQMGVTMQEYTGILESNFLNLRLGGTSAFRAMKQLRDETMKMRDSSSGVNEDFMRLGIGASDYGQLIAQNSMLLGGLTRAQETYGTGFAKKMLDTTRSVTALSDAFGFNREVVMKAANDALKDAKNRTIYNSIKQAGKEQMLAFFTGLYNGDAQKGMEATIAAFTGRFTENIAPLASMAPDQFPAMKEFSKGLAELGDGVKDPKQVEALLNRTGIERIARRIGTSGLQLAEAFYTQQGPAADAAGALLNLKDQFGSTDAAVKNVTERFEQQGKESDKTLQAVGELQRRNIEMAASFATTNKMLNKFGITVALTTQLMTKIMGKMAVGMMRPLTDLSNTFKLDDLAGTFTKDMEAMIDQAAKSAEEGYNKLWEKAVGEKPPSATAPAPTTGPAQTQGTVVGGERTVSVQGRQVAVNEMDRSGLEATRGGPTSLGVKQLIAALGAIRNINVTGAADTYHFSGKHPKGLAVDFTVEGGAKKAKETLTDIDTIMQKAGLKKGVDYNYLNEYEVKSPGWTGEHLHVEFLSGKAADAFYNAVQKNPAIVGQNNPVVTAPAASATETGTKKTDTKVSAATPEQQSKVTVAAAPETKGTANSQVNNATVLVADLSEGSISKLVDGVSSPSKELLAEFSRLREDIQRKIA